MLSTNTVGHAEIEACGETVRVVGTSTKKRVSVKQESPAIPRKRLAGKCQLNATPSTQSPITSTDVL